MTTRHFGGCGAAVMAFGVICASLTACEGAGGGGGSWADEYTRELDLGRVPEAGWSLAEIDRVGWSRKYALTKRMSYSYLGVDDRTVLAIVREWSSGTPDGLSGNDFVIVCWFTYHLARTGTLADGAVKLAERSGSHADVVAYSLLNATRLPSTRPDVEAVNRAALAKVLRLAPAAQADPGAFVADDASVSTRRDEILAMEIVEPWQVDAQWAAFSATGDLRFADRVIDLIDTGEPAAGETARSRSGPADWSLAWVMADHPRVMQRARERRAEMGGGWPRLDQIIAEAEKKLAEGRSRPPAEATQDPALRASASEDARAGVTVP